MTTVAEAAALIPPSWRDRVARRPPEGGPSGAHWAARLPHQVADLLAEWSLDPTGVAMAGCTAAVVPVRRDGEPLVLKVAWPHTEALGEHLALRRWAGEGAVRLVAADPARGGLLLEALEPGRDLLAEPVEEACAVVGALLARLHVPALPQLRTLSDFTAARLGRLALRTDALPRRQVERVTALAAELTSDPDCDATLLHGDLHYENVLWGRREPWLAIDPKPMAGHPGFEFQPLLRNRTQELGAGSAFRYLVRRRLEVACDAAGVDADQARAWSIVHTAIQALWSAQDGDRDGVTFSVALIKALER